MSRRQITFWFDFASTYSYLSAMRIGDMATRLNLGIRWQPFLLGPIFAEQGWDTSPFNLYPAKGAYMWRDLERQCEARNLAFMRPDPFPQHSLLAARVALAALEHDNGASFCREVFCAQFARGADISNPATIADCLHRSGFPETLMDKADDQHIKDRLRDHVSRARAVGIFGAPSFTVGSELFWGDDRLDSAMQHAERRTGELE